MRTYRSILALAALAAMTMSCAQSAGVTNPGYGGSGGTGAGGSGGTGTGGTSTGGTSTGGTGTGGTGTGGTSTGGTGTGGTSTGGTSGGAGTGGTGTGGTGTGGTSTGGTGTGGTSTGGTGTGGTGTGGTGTGGTGTGGTGGSTCTPPVSGGACDTFPQCGCASGQACTVVATTGVTGCVAPGNVQPNHDCSNGSCGVGYECVGSACKKYCATNADCGGQDCFQVTYTDTNGNPANVPGMLVCTSGCRLENPGTVCGPNLNCYQSSQTSSATDCGSAGTGTGANSCSSADPTTCAPGYVCLTDNSCAHWCRIGNNSDCPSGTCAGLTTPPVINGVTYGVCQ